MTEYLFVYGSLVPGAPNEHLLSGVEGTWEAASVTGSLRDKGWGAALGFPGIDLDKCCSEVQGFLFCSNELTKHWAMLDEFEGKSYKRVLTTVEREGQDDVVANIYILA